MNLTLFSQIFEHECDANVFMLCWELLCRIEGFAWLQTFKTSLWVIRMWVCVGKNNEMCDWCIVWAWFWLVCLISITLTLSS